MNANVLQWDGGPAHYEVYYLSVTDPGSATGLWIRYTMRSPADRAPGSARCGSWRWTATATRLARKRDLSDRGARGRARSLPAHAGRRGPLRPRDGRRLRGRRLGAARGSRRCRPPSTSTRCCGARASPRRCSCSPIRISRSRARCASPGASSSSTARAAARRTCGAPSTPRAGRGRTPTTCAASRASRVRAPTSTASASSCRASAASWDPARRSWGASAATTSARPARCASSATPSHFGLTSWHFEARDGKRRVVGEVDAPRDSLVGVTYHDPDGDLAYCYNSEVASMRVFVWDRTTRGRFGWTPARHARRRRHRPLRVRPARARRRRGAARHVSFRAAGEHLAIDLPGATALFTTRRGGVSEGPYASLNLGSKTDDDPRARRGQPRARARAGRRGAPRAGPPGPRDARRRRRRRAARRPTGRSPRSAGVARDRARGRLPAGRAGGSRAPPACVHARLARAGRRRARGRRRRPLGRGPVARGHRARASARAATRSATTCAPCSPRSERTLDLKAVARARLQAAGVGRSTTAACARRAIAQRFFSHRRDRGVTGRQAGLAWRS